MSGNLDKILKDIKNRTAEDIRRIEEADKKKFHDVMNKRQFDV